MSKRKFTPEDYTKLQDTLNKTYNNKGLTFSVREPSRWERLTGATSPRLVVTRSKNQSADLNIVLKQSLPHLERLRSSRNFDKSTFKIKDFDSLLISARTPKDITQPDIAEKLKEITGGRLSYFVTTDETTKGYNATVNFSAEKMQGFTQELHNLQKKNIITGYSITTSSSTWLTAVKLNGIHVNNLFKDDIAQRRVKGVKEEPTETSKPASAIFVPARPSSPVVTTRQPQNLQARSTSASQTVAPPVQVQQTQPSLTAPAKRVTPPVFRPADVSPRSGESNSNPNTTPSWLPSAKEQPAARSHAASAPEARRKPTETAATQPVARSASDRIALRSPQPRSLDSIASVLAKNIYHQNGSFSFDVKAIFRKEDVKFELTQVIKERLQLGTGKSYVAGFDLGKMVKDEDLEKVINKHFPGKPNEAKIVLDSVKKELQTSLPLSRSV